MNILNLIGRNNELFTQDIANHEKELSEIVSSSRFLVIGGAGSIGQAVTKEIFKRSPRKLHVVDISENNMVEVIRDIRSSFGYIVGDFQTFALDAGSVEYDAFWNAEGNYDYVLNHSSFKACEQRKRSEKHFWVPPIKWPSLPTDGRFQMNHENLLDNPNLRAERAEKGYKRAVEMFAHSNKEIRESLLNAYHKVIEEFYN
ncbi:Polysaccharide biosynthesis protein [Tangfeifania diversioriginum]|uniref:Polysaccharide biosynthesis protein n=1 Tax=Tangfeifania diversioriginum TaxID=1168035 RepID=A0A1M6NPF5_9BACT|nr:polysaccharide biosynthesis protein [Tangfeifania diversioriginum]SHJ97506.1 Polysaccharide biosynthesis protein [Tangfeifania diversioriginum]